MKNTKKLLGIFLSLVFAVSLFFATPITAEANYDYTVRISLGNNVNASFDEEYVKSLGYTLDNDAIEIEGETYTNRTVVIDHVAYNTTITLNLDKLVKLANGEDVKGTSYYINGIKQSGQDTVEYDGYSLLDRKNPTIKVDGNATYVVAYGVGATVPYTIRYVKASDGTKLLEDEILYGAVGEVLIVPARYIEGYRADANFKKNEKDGGLKAGELKTDEDGKDYVENGTVFTFRYSPYEGKTIYTDEYQYRTVYDEQSVSGTEGGTTVIDRRGQNGGQGGNAGGGNAGGNAGGEAAGEAGGGEPAPVVEPSPAPDIVDIADDDVARAGGEPQDKLVRNMIVAIIIAIIAVLVILIALIVADRKRKAQIANTNRKDDNE